MHLSAWQEAGVVVVCKEICSMMWRKSGLIDLTEGFTHATIVVGVALTTLFMAMAFLSV